MAQRHFLPWVLTAVSPNPMPSSRTPALHKHDPHNPTSYPVSSQQAPGRGVTAHISWLMGCDAQKWRMTCSRSNGWEGVELESAPSSSSSSIEISHPSSQALEATVSHSHFPKSSTQEGQTNGWPWAQHCGSTFTTGAHDNPLRKQEKTSFSTWGNSGQGREVTCQVSQEEEPNIESTGKFRSHGV